MSDGNLDVSVIVTCKGRLSHLKKTIGTLLSQVGNFSYEIVVVDYGCPDQTFKFIDLLCCAYDKQKLRCVRAQNDIEFWNLSRAMNCGACNSNGDNFLFVDADIFFPSNFIEIGFEKMFEYAGVQYCVNESPLGGNGDFYWHGIDDIERCPVSVGRMYRRHVFDSLRGFDESLADWGFQDAEFRRRFMLAGFRDCYVPGRVVFLNHGEQESVRFCRNQNKQETNEKNMDTAFSKREVNPGQWGQL